MAYNGYPPNWNYQLPLPPVHPMCKSKLVELAHTVNKAAYEKALEKASYGVPVYDCRLVPIPLFDWGATKPEGGYTIHRHPRAIGDKRARKITSGRIKKGL